MSQEDPSQTPPRNRVGTAALVLGIVSLVLAFVPVIGEFVAAPSALLAIVFGLVGLARVDRGIATNAGEALTGSILGVVSGLVLFLVIAATVGSG